MNDRLKFRIWLPKLNKFGDPKNAFIDFNGNIYGITRPNINDTFSLINIKEFKEFDDAVLQQYTGLTDSNEKEIYEGDILKVPFDVGGDVIGQVLYEADHGSHIFQWERKGPNQNYINLNCDVAFESVIIGNVNENSELLN